MIPSQKRLLIGDHSYRSDLRGPDDALRRAQEHASEMDHPETLRPRLHRAFARRDNAASHSPEWAAAMDEIDDLTARLARLAILARVERRLPVSTLR